MQPPPAPEGSKGWYLKHEWARLTRELELLSREVAAVRDKADKMAAAVELLPEELALVEQLHAKKLADHQKKSMIAILRDVTAHRNAYPFKTPVDTKLYKDYLTRVSNPMDLSTVKARLDAGQYLNNLDAYLSDVRQIFKNAYLYNAAGTDVYAMAKQLEDKFEERIKKMGRIRETLDSDRSPEEEKIYSGARQRFKDQALAWLSKQSERLDPQMQAADKQLSELKVKSAGLCQYVTPAEKQELVNLLSGLSEEEMEHAMQLVIYRHPASLPASTEVYDLEIGSLDALTLRQLLAFSNLCKKRKREGQDALWPGLPGGAGCPGLTPRGSKRRGIVFPNDSLAALPLGNDTLQHIAVKTCAEPQASRSAEHVAAPNTVNVAVVVPQSSPGVVTKVQVAVSGAEPPVVLSQQPAAPKSTGV